MNRILFDAGRGLLAGAVGTAAATLCRRAFTAWGRRGADPIARVGDRIEDAVMSDQMAAGGTAARWVYGAGLGVVRAVLQRLGLGGPVGTLSHLALAMGADEVVLPALGAVPNPKRDPKGLAADLTRHAVYALSVAGVLGMLRDRDEVPA